MRSFIFFILISALCLGHPSLHANPTSTPSLGQPPAAPKVDLSSSQPVIGKIETEFLGKEAVSKSYLANMIPLSSGQPYTDAAVNQAIQALYNTDHFDDIYTQKREQDGVIDITFVLTPRYRISDITIHGVKGRRRTTLLSKIKSKKDGILSEYHVHQDKHAISEVYKKKGFTQVRVEDKIEINEARGTAQVSYTVIEGERTRIGIIYFKGNEHLSAKELRKQVQIQNKGLATLLKGRGHFEKYAFAEDLERIKVFYQNHGFLDVQVPEESVKVTKNLRNRYFITIAIEEGPRYYLHDITFSGLKLFRADEMLEATTLKSKEPFSPARIELAMDNIRMHYGELGYLDTRTQAERYVHGDGTLSVHFKVKEGTLNTINSINIQGNTLTRSKVILREITLQPGDVFDLKRLRASEAKLRGTGFFKEVHITPEATGVEGKKNLRITVKENRDTMLTVGGQINSLDKLQATVQFVQPNFDIARPRTKFRGAGQHFLIGGSFGARSYDAFLNWEEPWLFDRKLALGTELNQRAHNYDIDYYAEKRRSASIYIRKPLFELVNATLTYQIENISISKVNEHLPQVIKDEEGTRRASKVALALSRDTRNSWMRPTKGNRFEYITQAAGGILGGHTEYWKNELKGIHYIPVHPYRNQTVSLVARGGSIKPLSEDGRVPFFDRYFLGGSSSLRGFRYRGVGPKVLAKNPRKPNGPLTPFSVGGNTFAMASVEYMIDIADMLSVAVFYDAGFVNEKQWDFETKGYSSNWGVGFLIPIMGSPLRLDFGFPLRGDQYLKDKRMNFEFSFGLLY